MSQNGTRTNFLPIILLIVGIAMIYTFDLITHQDAVAIVATILVSGAVLARWLLRGRRF
jgi:Flp pilus assembly protein TadB